MQWFLDHNKDVAEHVDTSQRSEGGPRLLLTIANRQKLERIYKYVFDQDEFLSDHGVRALSKYHKDHPYMLTLDGRTHIVDYEPGESTSDLFGGNSNWRGPIWFPLNFQLIESMQRVHYYYGDDFQVGVPRLGSGKKMSLWTAASEVSRRLTRTFLAAPRREEGGLRRIRRFFRMIRTGAT